MVNLEINNAFVDPKKIPKIDCQKYAKFLKLEITFWKKFIFSQFMINSSYKHHECFQESFEIVDLFTENAAELLQLSKEEKPNKNKGNLKKILEIRAKSDKKIKKKK